MAISSSLESQIRNLKRSLKNNISYMDVNFKGIDSDGSIAVSGTTCIINKLKIWLMSGSTDYHRNPKFGGFIEKNFFHHPLIEGDESALASQLKIAIEQKFPDLTVVKCNVTANISKRRWEIRLAVKDDNTGAIDDSMYSDTGSLLTYSVSD